MQSSKFTSFSCLAFVQRIRMTKLLAYMFWGKLFSWYAETTALNFVKALFCPGILHRVGWVIVSHNKKNKLTDWVVGDPYHLEQDKDSARESKRPPLQLNLSSRRLIQHYEEFLDEWEPSQTYYYQIGLIAVPLLRGRASQVSINDDHFVLIVQLKRNKLWEKCSLQSNLSSRRLN